MLAGQPASNVGATYGETSIGELLELVLATRGTRLDRQVLSATLRVLAEWLSEQSRLMASADEQYGAGGNQLRLLLGSPKARLTARERQVAVRVARGLSNRQIAQDLVIAVGTTERHVANILNKLGMRSRAEIAAWATRNGLI